MLKPLLSALRLTFASLPSRAVTSLVQVLTLAIFSAVLLGLLAMLDGFTAMVTSGGRADRAIILSEGASSELQSQLLPGDVALLENGDAIARDADGRPLLAPTTVSLVQIDRPDGTVESVVLRGAGDRYFDIYPLMVSGARPRRGLLEIMVGERLLARMPELAVGETVQFRGQDWRVTGVFTAGGGLSEDHLFGEIDMVRQALQIGGYQSAVASLTSPDAISSLEDQYEAVPELAMKLRREDRYLEDAGAGLRRLVRAATIFVGLTMSFGALAAAFASLHLSIDSRRTEIATLRALGYDEVGAGIVAESIALALAGALLGYALTRIFLVNTMVTTSGVSFHLAISPQSALIVFAATLAIGAVGVAPSAYGILRKPIAANLRPNTV